MLDKDSRGSVRCSDIKDFKRKRGGNFALCPQPKTRKETAIEN